MLNFHREYWNPEKKLSKALVFFAVSKQIPIVYSGDRGRAEIKYEENLRATWRHKHICCNKVNNSKKCRGRATVTK